MLLFPSRLSEPGNGRLAEDLLSTLCPLIRQGHVFMRCSCLTSLCGEISHDLLSS